MDISQRFDLHGRRALVTGSSRGIGRAIALALAQAGATVVVHGVHGETQHNATLDEVKKLSPDSFALAADLGDRAATARLGHEVGALDILVLNASVQSYQTVEDFTAEEMQRQYEVNVRSAFDLINAVAPGMRSRRWGRILGIGSVNQYKPSPRLAIYSTTKAALNNLLFNCARQYAADGVTVNNLAPGVICTDRNAEALKDDAYRQKVLGLIPAGYFGEPEDCAGLALLLCSDAGRYITGVDIPVAGGMDW